VVFRQGLEASEFMSTDIAQFLWVEGSLSTLEQLCLSSFLMNGYEVHLYTYKPVSGIPNGVQVLPAQDILHEKYVLLNRGVSGKINSYTAISDLFRLELLFQLGGWWFDMDMICLRHLESPSEFRVASTWEGPYGECPCNCAIWAHKGGHRIESLRDTAKQLIQQKGAQLGVPDTGVFPLQALIAQFSLQACVAPWWEFCPYPWRLVHRLAQRTPREYLKDRFRGLKHRVWERVDPSFKAAYPRSQSRTLHFHNEIWKAAGLGKDEHFFTFSPIEHYKRHFLLGGLLD
jgi:hypothetical protein